MSRAEYYRQYRQRKKSECCATVAQQSGRDLRQDIDELTRTVAELRDAVVMLQYVAQQNATCCATVEHKVSVSNVNDLDVASSSDIAQHVAQQKKSKRKGSFPPSSPPSHPPHTPPYSSPLLSPHPPKEKARENFAISSGENLPEPETETKVFVDPFPDLVDNPDAPLVDPAKAKGRDLATWRELEKCVDEIWEHTCSRRLQDAFYSWVEYKQERGAKDFYTRRGMLAEGKRFIRRHLEEFNVAAAVERAIASNWLGWDHDMKN